MHNSPGRTGSTTVLNMLNAHPIVRLAGEGGGQMQFATPLFETAAAHVNHHGASDYCSDPNNEKGLCSAYQRGAISPKDVMCDIQEYFDDVAVPVFSLLPHPKVSIRGFKDIQGWSIESLALLHSAFPCARVVYSVTNDPGSSDQVKAYVESFHFTQAQAKNYSLQQVALQQQAQAWHNEDIASGNAWRSFWLAVEDFTPDSFNELLQWMGETGCTFDGVVHANSASGGGYGVAGGTTLDAMRFLKGKCTLTLM